MVINNLYTNKKVLHQARQVYSRQKYIQLPQFFQPAVFKLLQSKLKQQKYKQKFHPYKHRYSTTKLKEIDAFIKGVYFATIIREIINLNKYRTKYQIRKFCAENYTLLHDTDKEPAGIDFMIDFSFTLQNSGGQTVYQTQKKELMSVKPFPNSITFIERKKGMMKYTKYVTRKQKKPLIFVQGAIMQTIK